MAKQFHIQAMQEQDKLTGKGEIQSLDPRHWVVKYADYLFDYAIARINDEQLARDLVQETFLAGLERAQGFKGQSSEKTWLTAILKNKVIDIYRKRSSSFQKKADQDLDAVDVDDFFNAADGHWKYEYRPEEFGIEHEDALEKKEFGLILQKCMQKLPPLWLAVFTMKHIDDEVTDVICRELKISSSNFWVIIHRAKVNMRACLQKNWI